jgi:hypothetical protein
VEVICIVIREKDITEIIEYEISPYDYDSDDSFNTKLMKLKLEKINKKKIKSIAIERP